MPYYAYIASNKWNTVLYIGVTNDLRVRASQHAQRLDQESFTARYNVNKIVWYETFQNIQDAIRAEKQLKGWRRGKKLSLIRAKNPRFEDVLADKDPSTSSG